MLLSGLLALSKRIGQNTSTARLKAALARWVQPA